MNSIISVLKNVLIFFLLNIITLKSQDVNKILPFSIQNNYFPTGWMGDGQFGEKNIYFFNSWVDTSRPDAHCIKVNYHTQGPIAWAGIYWQNKPNNWGDFPGGNFLKYEYTKLTFWAKGEEGGEVIKFKSGGIGYLGRGSDWHPSSREMREYSDSFIANTGYVILEKEWRKYTINLENKNLSSVIGGFCWVIDSHGYSEKTFTIITSENEELSFWDSPKKIDFYLDDIQIE